MNTNKAELNALKYESDAFSDLLRLLKLNVDIYHNATVCGDWVINEHKIGATCFHLVTRGACLLQVAGGLETELHCGDIVIFPKEMPHRMIPLHKQSGKQQHLPYRFAQDLNGTGMLCGEVRFHHKSSLLLLTELPDVFIIPYKNDVPWMGFLLEMIFTESLAANAASKAILDKLSEMLFTYALRQYLSDNPEHNGLLSLYLNSRIANAINRFHQHPEKNWTLELLAREAAMSRTVFSETFKSISGWTTGQYLIWWRMQLAWSALENGSSVAETALKVGYQSEAAFSRAFQKTFSITAGKVRRAQL